MADMLPCAVQGIINITSLSIYLFTGRDFYTQGLKSSVCVLARGTVYACSGCRCDSRAPHHWDSCSPTSTEYVIMHNKSQLRKCRVPHWHFSILALRSVLINVKEDLLYSYCYNFWVVKIRIWSYQQEKRIIKATCVYLLLYSFNFI